MAVPSPVPDKKQIRREMRRQRQAFIAGLEPATREALEERLAELLSPMLAGASIVGAYTPIGAEISPRRALERARRLGRTVAYPSFDEGFEQFCYRAGDPDMPGPFNIPQPGPEAPVVIPDLLLIPMVAIDRDGYRLGQGKGHFDRVLPGLPDARRIAIGWQMQRVETQLPRDEWDVPMHVFASPRGIEEFGA